MDISSWGLGEIMQLPDHVFGERFVISTTVNMVQLASAWDISEVAFPENAVIWEFGLIVSQVAGQRTWCRVALGDQLPTTPFIMTALDPLIMGLGEQGADPRAIFFTNNSGYHVVNIRKALRSAGRRLVLEVRGVHEKIYEVTCFVVVSAIPRSVPDWLHLG